MSRASINPATLHHIRVMEHYAKLEAEKRTTERLEENRKREEQRRVQETDKGQNVDIMV